MLEQARASEAERAARLREAFRAETGREPEHFVRAPGRVNLIGEHTDYQEGLVLPCAIDRDTRVMAAPRGDGVVRAFSLPVQPAAPGAAPARTRFRVDAPARRGDWSDYLQAMVQALGQRGLRVAGAELGVESELPREAGLSSSAALGVAVVAALARLHGFGLTSLEVARVAHLGESHFVATGCGVMDQVASALGQAGQALRIDCRSLALEPVPLPATRAVLLLAGSGVARRLAAGGYRARVDECAAALAGLRAAGVAPEARALRDLAPESLAAAERVLPERLFRRVRHVVSENARVERSCAALRRGDLPAVGAELRAGMASLRHDFEVSTPELDRLCELADAEPGVFGSRLTGAGLGGWSLHLVRPDALEGVAAALAEGFAARFGRLPPLRVVRPDDGLRVLSL